MKLKDFELKQRNIALPGAPEKMGEWLSGSNGNIMAIGVCGGKKYQVKIRANKPKWICADKSIAEKKAMIRASVDPCEKERLELELSSMEASRDKNNEKDRINDMFVAEKNAIFNAVNSIGRPEIIACSKEIWKENVAFKSDALLSIEASPWVDKAVGVDRSEGMPVSFREDFTKAQKYKIFASFAETLALLHAKGIVHSDLKIGNTLIVKVGGEYKVCLIDFDSAFILDHFVRKTIDKKAWENILGGTYFSAEFWEAMDIYKDGSQSEYDGYDASKITAKIDMIGFACTIWEYLFGDIATHPIPFVTPAGEPASIGVDDYPFAFQEGYKVKLPTEAECPEMDDLMFGILNWLFELNPADRPDAATVAKVFATGDMSLIPGKHKRFDVTVPHEEDGIEFVKVDNVKIERFPDVKGVYKVMRFSRSGACSTSKYTVKQLVTAGYAKLLDGATIEEVVVTPTVTEPAKTWPSDANPALDLPACITRKTGSEGKYVLMVGAMRANRSFAELKAMGFFCSDAETKTFWPTDKVKAMSITVKPDHVLVRDFAKGPSNYKVVLKRDADRGVMESSISVHFSKLVERGYAISGASAGGSGGSCQLTEPRPVDKFVFLPDKIPATVISIAKSPSKGNGWYVIRQKNSAGADESKFVNVADLISLGYAKSI